MTTKRQQQEEIERVLQEHQASETSYAINGCLRWLALIVILIAAMYLGT